MPKELDIIVKTIIGGAIVGFCSVCIAGFFYLNTALASSVTLNTSEHACIRKEFLDEIKGLRAERREDMQILKRDILQAISR